MCVYKDLKKSIRSSQKWTILTEKKFFRRIEISSPADDTVSRKVIKKVRVGRVGPSATTVTSVSAGGGDKWNTKRAMGSKLRPRPRRITVEQLDSQCSAPRESHFSPFLGKQRSSPFVPPYERIVGKGTGGEARRAIETTKKSRFRKLVKRYKGKEGGVLSRRHFLSRVAQWRGKVVTFFLSSSFSLSVCFHLRFFLPSPCSWSQTQIYRLFIKTWDTFGEWIRIHIYPMMYLLRIYECWIFVNILELYYITLHWNSFKITNYI